MICPNCQTPNPDGAVVCLGCSSSLRLDRLKRKEASGSTSTPVSAPTMLPAPFEPPRAATGLSVGGGAVQPQNLDSGVEVGQRYRVIRLLGRGGMGAVYLAHDRELDRDVALKVIRPDVANDPETLERFKREIQLSSLVTDRHVLRVYDLGESGGIKFVTMQFVDGEDLAALIKREGKLPQPRIVDIFRQICLALQAAHEQGVIHRDLKPHNVMLDKTGGVYLTDFGLAKSMTQSGMTQTGALMGTPFYMSPEQVRGEAADHRSDIYTLGVILYELATGQVPFSGGTAFETMMQRLQRAPQPISELNPDVPLYLRKVIERCMALDIEARYQSVTEILADLSAASFSARPSTRPRGRRFLLGLAAAAGLAALATAAAWLYVHKPAPQAAAARTPESVLVADFENRTGDSVFEGALEPVFGLAIEGASFISAYNRAQAKKVVAQIKPGATGLDEGTARLVAVREGINVVTSGTVERRGAGYVLSVRAVEPESGKVIIATDVEMPDKEAALAAAAKLAARVRSALGDLTPESAQLAAAETFSAGSVEAAHEYAVAQERQWEGKVDEAIAHYSKAVEFDPNLGRAYAGLAALYGNQGRREESEKSYQQAMARIDRMSEREKFRTRGAYYLTMRQPDKALEQFEQLVKLYPADTAGIANMALAHFYKREMAGALADGRKAIEIYPKNVLQRNNVALYAMYASDFDSAIKEAEAVLKLNDAYPKAYLALGLSKLALGAPQGAASAYEKLATLGARGASLASIALADLALWQGRSDEAVAALTRGIEADLVQKTNTAAAVKMAALAAADLAAGRTAPALAAADRAVATGKGDAVLFPAARVYLEAGRESRALAIADQLAASLERDSQAYARLIRGEVKLRQGKPREAIKDFEEAKGISDTWMGRFDLGRAYLEAGAFTEADTELEACVKRRGEATALFLDDVPTYRVFPPALYYLGRAQEGLKSPAAAESYKAFLAVKEKGGGGPLVEDARRRLKTHP